MSNRPVVVLLLLVAWGALALPAAGDRLTELESRAVERSPDLIAMRERVEAARAREHAAGVLPDPRLEIDVMDAVPGGGRPLDARPRLVQPLPGRGKRAAQREIARAETALAQAELAWAERRRIADLRGAWGEVWRWQTTRHLQMEAHELMRVLVAAETASYAGGEGSLADVLDVRRRVRSHEQEQTDADAAMLDALSRLAELAGGGELGFSPHAVELPDGAFPEGAFVATAERSPRVEVPRRSIVLAERRLEATRLERRSDWSVGAGVRAMDGESTELTAGFGVELPFFRRRRVEPRIDAASAELRAGRSDLAASELEVRSELERLTIERFRYEDQLRRLREGLLPESLAAFEAARAEIADGRGSVARAAMRLEEWTRWRIDEARLEAALFATRAAMLAHQPADGDPSAEGSDPGGRS